MDAQLVCKKQLPWEKKHTCFIDKCDTIWYRLSLWPVQVSCPGCVTSQPLALLPNLQPAAGGQSEKHETLNLCKHCSAIDKMLVCYQYWFGHKSKTQNHTGCCEENKLLANQLEYNFWKIILRFWSSLVLLSLAVLFWIFIIVSSYYFYIWVSVHLQNSRYFAWPIKMGLTNHVLGGWFLASCSGMLPSFNKLL